MITVIPFCNKDATAQAKNLQWILELDGKQNRSCLVSWEDGTNQEYVARIRELASAAFSDVKEFSYPEATNKHWPAGPNWAWQSVARYIPMAYKNDAPWFWLEADAVPLKKGWLDTLEAEYKAGGKPFMGHIVKQMGHMNGVAIYPHQVSAYGYRALLVENAAWDVVLKEDTIDHTHRGNRLIQHCWVFINNEPSHNGDGPVATFRDTSDVKRVIEPDAVLFHRCKDGSLIDCLHAMHTVVECNGDEAVTTTGNTGVTTTFDSEVPESFSSGIADITAGRVVDMEVALTQLPPSYPKTEIFIVTYYKDAEWLKYSLYSIKKFARGFTGVTVMCPDRDIEVIEPIVREFGPAGTLIEMYAEVEGKGMLHHMAAKCMADQFVNRANYILHTDSDCIFTEPVTPADYFVDGKPVLLKEAYERFREKHPGILKWKENAEHALGFECNFETMRRHPSVYRRDLYPEVRNRIERKHGMKFLDYVLSRKPDYPQGFCEFPTLGAYALAMHPKDYHWIDTGETLAPKDKICQMWSHGGLDRPCDTGAWPGQTPREIIKRILGV